MVSGANDSKTPPIVSLTAGGVAGGIEAFTSYPLEFAKTRVQLRSQKGIPTPKNPFLVVTRVYQKEGIRSLYKGCAALVVGSIGKDGVRFLFFDQIKHAFADPQTGTLSPLRNLAAGMTAGVVASITCVTPTERIKTALIDDARNEKRFRSGLHATSVIWKEHGILGLYRGFVGTTLKQASATAFRLGTYNILKDFETTRNIPQNTATNFANGSVAGIVTTLCTQPFDVIKTRSQSAHGMSTAEAVKSVLVDYGIKGFWKGTTMRLGRTVFSGGILFTSYEAAVKIISPLYSGLTHMVVAETLD
ncbi:tricarboxylate transport protein-like protein [Lindgomyces ingoldianus]|uniref:Tricarboxylate transport protein-like protein n=1 Tax=Lindgomyces ingoldianus TaxID=673940 RepID=A0ACB6QB31_9PLEO|nr:tricarboxylate transport protein-like protein [Lindgomyces ingoldianus]KAF2464111.1 tricarboxylate transport protein-like protein [Lindgomyces ingoldianus]